jgi:DNA-binding transcriptional ArsR family regulator
VSHEIYRALIDTDRRTGFRGRGRQARHLAFELLDRAHGSADGSLPVAASHEDLAQVLGSSREVVTRHLSRLARMGMIRQVDRRQIAVLNEVDLLAFARNEGTGSVRPPTTSQILGHDQPPAGTYAGADSARFPARGLECPGRVRRCPSN